MAPGTPFLWNVLDLPPLWVPIWWPYGRTWSVFPCWVPRPASWQRKLDGFVCPLWSYCPLCKVWHGTCAYWPFACILLHPLISCSSGQQLIPNFSSFSQLLHMWCRIFTYSKQSQAHVQVLSTSPRILWRRHSHLTIYSGHSASECLSSLFLLQTVTQIAWPSDLAIPRQ